MSEVEEEQIELHQPLEILRSTARRLMERQIPASATRLEELYAHLKGAVADSLDQVTRHVTQALELTRASLPDEGEGDQQAAAVVDRAHGLLSEVQDELEEALGEIKDSFFSAHSFQECEARLPNLALFESRLEKSMLRLEQAVAMVDDPELYGLSAYEPVPSVTDALEALAEGLDHIQQHLVEGDREALKRALESVNKAQLGISAALNEE